MYTGLLDVVTGVDGLGGTAIDLGRIHLGVRYASQVVLANRNPVDVVLRYYVSALTTVTVALVSINDSATDGARTNLPVGVAASGHTATRTFRGTHPQRISTTSENGNHPVDAEMVNMVLEPGMTVVFSVGVFVATKARVDAADGIEFVTQFQRLRVPVRYHAKQHVLHITPKSLSFAPTLPGVFQVSPRVLADKQAGGSNIEISDTVKYLLPLEELHIQMSPRDRLGEITRVHSDDPRFVIRPLMLNVAGAGKSTDAMALVNLSSVVFDPTRGPWSENYIPQFGPEAGTARTLPLLTADTIREAKRAKQAWVSLVQKKRHTIRTRIHVESATENAEAIDVRARLHDVDLGLPATVTFPLTQVRHVAREELVFTNPTQYPVLVGLESLDVYRNNPIVNSLVDLLDLSQSDIDAAMAAKSMFNATIGGEVARRGDDGEAVMHTTIVKPYGRVSLSVEFHPDMAGSLTSAFLIRNNLTLVQALSVSGEAGRGTFGFPKNQSFIVDGGLSFPITATNLSYCRLAKRMSHKDAVRAFVFNVTVANRGNMPVRVERMSIGGTGACAAAGFAIDSCEPFVLRTKHFKTFSISVQPDFTTATMAQSLVVHLEGLDRPMRFNMEALLPRDAVKVCSDALPGPSWETTFKATAVVTMVTLAVLLSVGEYAAGSWHDPQRFNARPRTRTSSSQAVDPATLAFSPRATIAPPPTGTTAVALLTPPHPPEKDVRDRSREATPRSVDRDGGDGPMAPQHPESVVVVPRADAAPSKKRTKKQQALHRKGVSTPTLDVEWESVGKHSKKSGRHAAGSSTRSSPVPIPPTPPVEPAENATAGRKNTRAAKHGAMTTGGPPHPSTGVIDPVPVTATPAAGSVVPATNKAKAGKNVSDAESPLAPRRTDSSTAVDTEVDMRTAASTAMDISTLTDERGPDAGAGSGQPPLVADSIRTHVPRDAHAQGAPARSGTMNTPTADKGDNVTPRDESTATRVDDAPVAVGAHAGGGVGSTVQHPRTLHLSPLSRPGGAPSMPVTAPSTLFQNLPTALPPALTLTDLSAYGVPSTSASAMIDNFPRGVSGASSTSGAGLDLWTHYDSLSGGNGLGLAPSATSPFVAGDAPRTTTMSAGAPMGGLGFSHREWSTGDAMVSAVGGTLGGPTKDVPASAVGRAGSDGGRMAELHAGAAMRSDSDGTNDSYKSAFTRNIHGNGYDNIYLGAPGRQQNTMHSRPPGLPVNDEWLYSTQTAPFSPPHGSLRRGTANNPPGAGNAPSALHTGDVGWSAPCPVHSAPSSPPPPASVASGRLPSIPYAGMGGSSIWASGSGDFGELDWVKPESKNNGVNPNAQEWDGW